MKIATTVVYEVIAESELFRDIAEEHVYVNKIPETATKKPNLPLMRICELDSRYDDYASNEAWSFEYNVQIDLWVEDLEEVNKYYFEIDNLMKKNGWVCTYSSSEDDEDVTAQRIIKRYKTNISLINE